MTRTSSTNNFSNFTGVYCFGFNGKENDNSTSADSYDFGARILDARIGRWLSVDPLLKHYPFAGSFIFTLGNPILFEDIDGRDIVISNNGEEFTFSSESTTYSGSNAFIAETVKALNHLITYEIESNAQFKVVTELANDKSVQVRVTEIPINDHPSAVGSAEWNPKQGTYVRDSETGEIAPQSPAGTLLHELAHQYDDIYKTLSEQLPPNPTIEAIDEYEK